MHSLYAEGFSVLDWMLHLEFYHPFVTTSSKVDHDEVQMLMHSNNCIAYVVKVVIELVPNNPVFISFPYSALHPEEVVRHVVDVFEESFDVDCHSS